MGTEILESLEGVLTSDRAELPPPKALRDVEYQLAVSIVDCLEGRSWLPDKAVDRLVQSCQSELPLAAILVQRVYPCSATRAQRLRAVLTSRLRRGEVRQRQRAQQIIAAYHIDDQLVAQAVQAVADLDQICQHHQPAPLTWMRTGGAPQRQALLGRSVFLALRTLWNEEESDQPILWRVADVIDSVARSGSYLAIGEGLARLAAVGLAQMAMQETTDTLRDFIIQANDDVNANLLDNLVLAERTYRDLVAGGWKADRWEIENLPMTVGLFIKFMGQVGVEQAGSIGTRLQITLREAHEAYRYSGTPFISPDEHKEVVVRTPGWRYRGELIVRPKVREVTE